MSNIPNAAMPHAWTHGDDDGTEGGARRTSANQEGFSFAKAAIVGGLVALFFWWRRK